MRPLSAGQALAEVLVDELARSGVRHACLSPGSRSAHLARALAEHPVIRAHVSIDERSASFQALGIAKSSGRPAVVVSTSGTAAANLHPAVLEAHHSRTPLVVLTADRPPELRDSGATQTVDQIKMFGSAVRWFVEVGVPEARPGSVAYWRSLAARACRRALASPPGPVHLNLAFREPLVPEPDDDGWLLPVDGRPGSESWTHVVTASTAPDESQVAFLGAEVCRYERGLVIAGASHRGLEGMAALAAAARWPLIAEPSSGARVDQSSMSCYEALLRSGPWASEHRPEIVVRAGALGLSKALLAHIGHARQILVDPDGEWLDPDRSVDVIVEADASRLCQEVAKSIAERPPTEWWTQWSTAETAARTAIDDALDAEPHPTEPRTARDLARCLPQGATLVVASSMPIRDLDWFMHPRSAMRVIANRGANGIDGFVSTAAGVAITSAGPTVALCGDLSLLHDQNGLLTSDEIDLVIVVVNNDGGGIFSFLGHAEHAGFDRLFRTPHGIDLRGIAETYGSGYARVGSAADLVPTVLDAIAGGGLHIIEIRTDPVANVNLHRRLWELVADAI